LDFLQLISPVHLIVPVDEVGIFFN